VGLLVVNIPFLTVMGLAAAGTVAIAVLIALTLIPALLGFAGDRIARYNRVFGRRLAKPKAGEKMSIRWATFVTRRPGVTLAAGLIVMLVAAIPALDLKLGLPDDGTEPESTTARKAYDRLTEGFGPGFNGTLTVVVNVPDFPRDDQIRLASQVERALEGFPGVAAVSPPTQNFTHDVTVVTVTPTSSPHADETKDLVVALRAEAETIREESGIEAFVTGTTALNIDTSDSLSAAMPRYILLVVGLAMLLLTAVFRSILVPIKAAVGFLLTIAAALGVTVWIFQQGNLGNLFAVDVPAPIISFLPILMIGILFGLAMDYQVFLVSRMREDFVHTGGARRSIITGFGHSGRVVTAAALIMFGVFGAFVLAPDPITKSIGVCLAVGVLADAFIVRMTLVPAVMALMGDRAWWIPGWLDRLLPNLDVEGERVAAPAPAPAAPVAAANGAGPPPEGSPTPPPREPVA